MQLSDVLQKTGKNWTMEDLEEAIEVRPHLSDLDPEAMEQLQAEVAEKEALGQAKVVLWDDIKNDPPKALKISRIAVIPHKLRKFRAILDLSYTVKLMECRIEAVNDTTTKTAPQGAMDQMGHVLDHIIYAYTEAEKESMIFAGKTDVKDGFGGALRQKVKNGILHTCSHKKKGNQRTIEDWISS